jgi:hypothetical protein
MVIDKQDLELEVLLYGVLTINLLHTPTGISASGDSTGSSREAYAKAMRRLREKLESEDNLN